MIAALCLAIGIIAGLAFSLWHLRGELRDANESKRILRLHVRFWKDTAHIIARRFADADRDR